MPNLTVYTAVAAITAALSVEGISKDRRNQQQGYAYRGIDDMYNALAPLLSEHGVVIYPVVKSREVSERTTRKGDPLYFVCLQVDFVFVLASDPSSCFTVSTYGEGMDSADKATNKALSAAYKYAVIMTFAIPVEGTDDADATTPEPAPAKQAAPSEAAQRAIKLLAHFSEMIAKNDAPDFVMEWDKLTESQRDWVYKRLTEDQQEWTAKVLEEAEA